MKEAYYFPHDANARTDAKILELRAELGWEGYGLWWALVEQLREATDYRLSNEKTGGLAMGLNIQKKQLEALLALCFDLGLLELEEGFFYSPSLRRRMVALDNKRLARAESARNAAEKRWQKPTDANALPPHEERMPDAMPIDATIEESKEDLTKPKESKEETSSLRSEDAATAAASEPEKKIEAEPVFENPDEAQTPPPVAKPPRAPRRSAEALSGPLADLLNAGGLADEVQGMKKPFSQQQADELVSKYGEGPAREIVQEMANWKPLHQKCQSASLTAQNWLNKRQPAAPAQWPQQPQQPFRPQQPISQVGKRQELSSALHIKYANLKAQRDEA